MHNTKYNIFLSGVILMNIVLVILFSVVLYNTRTTNPGSSMINLEGEISVLKQQVQELQHINQRTHTLQNHNNLDTAFGQISAVYQQGEDYYIDIDYYACCNTTRTAGTAIYCDMLPSPSTQACVQNNNPTIRTFRISPHIFVDILQLQSCHPEENRRITAIHTWTEFVQARASCDIESDVRTHLYTIAIDRDQDQVVSLRSHRQDNSN